MKSRINEQGSALHIIVITGLVIAILGLLGFVFWQNFLKKDQQSTATTSSGVKTDAAKCPVGDDVNATSGVFCSEQFGVRFSVPDEFKGRLKEAENVNIYPVSDVQPESLGKTEAVYNATVTKGQYDYVLTVSLLPQIDGMSLGTTGSQFDIKDKKIYSIVSSVENPAFHRDGEYTFVTSKNDVKVYRYTFGDVGYLSFENVIVVGDKVVVISLKDNPTVTEGLPTETPTVDDAQILATLDLLN